MDDLRTTILGFVDRVAPATVSIPEWGGVTIHLRRLSIKERFSFESENGSVDSIDRKKEPDKYVRWVVRYAIATACSPTGERVFHPEDEDALMAKSGTAVERLVLAAMKVNLVTAEEIAALGKSSGEAPNGASPSVSPATSN